MSIDDFAVWCGNLAVVALFLLTITGHTTAMVVPCAFMLGYYVRERQQELSYTPFAVTVGMLVFWFLYN